MEARDLRVVIGSGATCGIGDKTACLLATMESLPPSQSLFFFVTLMTVLIVYA